MELIGTWIMVGCVTAILGIARGRHFLHWLLIGLALPCVGIVIVLSLPPLRAAPVRDRGGQSFPFGR